MIDEFSSHKEPDYLIKVVLVGDSSVGKSNIVLRYSQNQFFEASQPTIGVEFVTTTMDIDGKLAKIQIWDTAGQERFRAITSTYYHGAMGAILVYDITSASSFQNIKSHWIDEVRKNTEGSMTILLVGNKIDLADQRAVSVEQAKNFAEEEHLFFMETSAKDATNILPAFQTIIKEIVSKMSNDITPGTSSNSDITKLRQAPAKIVQIDPPHEDQKKSCC